MAPNVRDYINNYFNNGKNKSRQDESSVSKIEKGKSSNTEVNTSTMSTTPLSSSPSSSASSSSPFFNPSSSRSLEQPKSYSCFNHHHSARNQQQILNQTNLTSTTNQVTMPKSSNSPFSSAFKSKNSPSSSGYKSNSSFSSYSPQHELTRCYIKPPPVRDVRELQQRFK